MKNYYQIETGRQGDPEYVMLKEVPKGTGAYSYRMAEGERMADRYPADAVLTMGPRCRGIELPSLIGNIFSILIVNRPLKEVFETAGVEIEFLPFTLVGQKGRVLSKDYFIINPIGAFDCIDFAASDIVYGETHKDVICGVNRLVLDPRKLEKAPDFFRIDRQPRRYVVSEAFGARLAKLEPTNVMVHKLEQSTPGK